jgi:transcriptional regulator with XRE-family HTH domain
MKSSRSGNSDEMHMQIGRRIRKLRQARHISQSTLADSLGLDRSSVCKWENGQSMPSIEHMKCLADYFGVPVETISSGSKNTLERGKAFADAFLMTHGNIPLSSLTDYDEAGGKQDVTGDDDSEA